MKNEYEIRGDITAIIIDSPKYGKMESFISTNKLQKANEFIGSWLAAYNKHTKSFYVFGHTPRVKGLQTTVQLHRWITNAPSRLVCDHVNHNTLDNTDENLRLIENADNLQNRKGANRGSSSGIRGVSWEKINKKWRARVKLNNKEFHIGYFDDIEEARIAVESARENMMPFSEEAYRNAN